MRINDDYRHFVTIAAGEDPDSLMKPYDMKMKVNPYVVYRLNDAGKIRKEYIMFYEKLIEGKNAGKDELEEIRDELEEIKEMSDIDFFYMVTDGCNYDLATGDAVSDENPNGKWLNYELGKRFSLPFILKDGSEKFRARKKDIAWDKIHLNGKEVYETAWDLVVGKKKPENDYEKEIYENMKNRLAYFMKFSTKENYVMSCTAFWGIAFVSDAGWVELEDHMDQFEWMKNYYDRFIKPLPDDTLLSVFECWKG